jgi:ribosomal protein L32
MATDRLPELVDLDPRPPQESKWVPSRRYTLGRSYATQDMTLDDLRRVIEALAPELQSQLFLKSGAGPDAWMHNVRAAEARAEELEQKLKQSEDLVKKLKVVAVAAQQFAWAQEMAEQHKRAGTPRVHPEAYIDPEHWQSLLRAYLEVGDTTGGLRARTTDPVQGYVPDPLTAAELRAGFAALPQRAYELEQKLKQSEAYCEQLEAMVRRRGDERYAALVALDAAKAEISAAWNYLAGICQIEEDPKMSTLLRMCEFAELEINCEYEMRVDAEHKARAASWRAWSAAWADARKYYDDSTPVPSSWTGRRAMREALGRGFSRTRSKRQQVAEPAKVIERQRCRDCGNVLRPGVVGSCCGRG